MTTYMGNWLSLVMSMMVSFCAVFFPRVVLDEILNLIESVSKGFPSYSVMKNSMKIVFNGWDMPTVYVKE